MDKSSIGLLRDGDVSTIGWSTALLTIVSIDVVSTILLVGSGIAAEANPLMEPIVKLGDNWFVVFKLGGAVFGLLLLEVIRRMGKGKEVRTYLRMGVVLYVLSYIIFFLQINYPLR